ncbi:MAG TPA: hypothetical protein VGJ01_05910, partial [Pseudolabrys sp.]
MDLRKRAIDSFQVGGSYTKYEIPILQKKRISLVGAELSRHTEGQGVGASVRRKEDRRYLNGEGEYVADIQVPGMAEV